MSDFYRTLQGRNYYEKDIPKLISVLDRIAKQMEESNIRENKKFLLEEKLYKLQMKKLNENTEK